MVPVVLVSQVCILLGQGLHLGGESAQQVGLAGVLDLEYLELSMGYIGLVLQDLEFSIYSHIFSTSCFQFSS